MSIRPIEPSSSIDYAGFGGGRDFRYERYLKELERYEKAEDRDRLARSRRTKLTPEEKEKMQMRQEQERQKTQAVNETIEKLMQNLELSNSIEEINKITDTMEREQERFINKHLWATKIFKEACDEFVKKEDETLELLKRYFQQQTADIAPPDILQRAIVKIIKLVFPENIPPNVRRDYDNRKKKAIDDLLVAFLTD